MKRLLLGLALGAVVMGSGTAMAAVQTVTLAVENMTCESCPYIVKKTLASVPGVTRVDVSLEKKTAVVTFDDTKTTLKDLTAASASAGYPARPVAGSAK